jgi:hypothetical protein
VVTTNSVGRTQTKQIGMLEAVGAEDSLSQQHIITRCAHAALHETCIEADSAAESSARHSHAGEHNKFMQGNVR